MGAQQGHFFVGVAGKVVEHHKHRLPETLQVAYVAVEVGKTCAQPLFVGLFDAVEGHAAVHFQSLRRGHDDGEVGTQSALAAEDIVEFLCAEVGTESSLRDGIFGVGHGHARGEEGVATVGDVGEGAAVHDGGRVFSGLHEVGLNGIFKEHHDGACHAEVFHGERLSLVGVAEEYVLDAPAQVVLIGCEAEDSHEFGGGGDVEASLRGKPVR